MRYNMRYKIQGKIYNFVADLINPDNKVIDFKKLIENSKKEKFILVKSSYTQKYHLYTPSGKRILDFNTLTTI